MAEVMSKTLFNFCYVWLLTLVLESKDSTDSNRIIFYSS